MGKNTTSKGSQSPNKRTLGWDPGLLRVPEMKAHTGLPSGLQAWGALRRHISGAHSVWKAEPPAKGPSQWKQDKGSQGLSPPRVLFIIYIPTIVITQQSLNIPKCRSWDES